jgi:hypothetical protein
MPDMDLTMDFPDDCRVGQVMQADVAAISEVVQHKQVVKSVPKRRRKRKARVMPKDSRTELSSKQISEGLKEGGCDDIVLASRPMVLKRSRMERPDFIENILMNDTDDLIVEEVKEAIRTSLLHSSVAPFFRDTATMAPELVETMRSTLTTSTPLGVAVMHEAAELAPEVQEQELPDFDFDMGMDLGGVNQSPDMSVISGGLDQSLDVSFQSNDFKIDEKGPDEDVENFFEEHISSQATQEENEEVDESKQQLGGWSARTKKMHLLLANEFGVEDKPDRDELSFDELMAGKNRRAAAVVFYQLLVLKTHKYVDTEQNVPYGDITIKTDSNFYSTVSA